MINIDRDVIIRVKICNSSFKHSLHKTNPYLIYSNKNKQVWVFNPNLFTFGDVDCETMEGATFNRLSYHRHARKKTITFAINWASAGGIPAETRAMVTDDSPYSVSSSTTLAAVLPHLANESPALSAHL